MKDTNSGPEIYQVTDGSFTYNSSFRSGAQIVILGKPWAAALGGRTLGRWVRTGRHESATQGHLKKAALTLGKNELQVSFKDGVISVIEWRVLGYTNILWKAFLYMCIEWEGKEPDP